MPFNGSGTFLRVRNWVNDAAAGIKIRADRHDSEDDNLASGLSQCITKDGQTTITANLPMATYRHTNVGAATALTQYARYDQVNKGDFNWKDAGGTGDAITVSNTIAFTSLTDGMEVCIRISAANTVTNPTLNVDGLGARDIVSKDLNVIPVGAFYDGLELILRYDLSNTRWVAVNFTNKFTSDIDGDATYKLVNMADGTSAQDYATVAQTQLPVGSIYMNASVSTNPATLLGYGTWVAVGVDRVLVGVGSTYPTAGATGGSATQTLSSSNNGPHGHTFFANASAGVASSGLYQGFGGSIGTTTFSYSAAVGSSGSGTAFSIMPPYEVVYMWKRTA